MPTVSYPIANTADDVTELVGLGLNDTAVVAGLYFGFTSYFGLRFVTDASAPPQATTLTSAILRVKRDDSGGATTGTQWGGIRVVDSANAPAWTTTGPAAAAKLGAAVPIVDGATVDYDVTALVQAIWNKATFAPGNAVALVGDPTGANGAIAWIDRNASATDCAQLSITYSTGGPDVTPPTITSSDSPSVVEGSALSHALTANEPVTWAIVGGADAALFSLTGSTLSLPAQTSPSGPFEVVVRATDAAGNETDQTISVSITEAPTEALLVYAASDPVTSISGIPCQVGDLILVHAYRAASAVAPSLPAGFTNIVNGAGNTNGDRLGFKIATSTSETTGTWTNTTGLAVQVWRNVDPTDPIGVFATATQVANPAVFPALALERTDGSSRVAGFIGTRSTASSVSNAPAGMETQTSNVTSGTGSMGSYATPAGVASWSSANMDLTPSGNRYRIIVVEIKAAPGSTPTARPTFQAYIID